MQSNRDNATRQIRGFAVVVLAGFLASCAASPAKNDEPAAAPAPTQAVPEIVWKFTDMQNVAHFSFEPGTEHPDPALTGKWRHWSFREAPSGEVYTGRCLRIQGTGKEYVEAQSAAKAVLAEANAAMERKEAQRPKFYSRLLQRSFYTEEEKRHAESQFNSDLFQKDWQRWYDRFIADGYTADESRYKANQMMRGQ